MFDLPLPLPIHPTASARGFPPHFLSGNTDPSHPFALPLSRRAAADLMSGRAAPLVFACFATLGLLDAQLGVLATLPVDGQDHLATLLIDVRDNVFDQRAH